jgi:hypothetical protein
MKLVQTLWTKPGLRGGWVDVRFHFISWALSCFQLRKYYDQLELNTDSLGKHILIDVLKLPYTNVNVIFDKFNYPKYLWAAPKIYSYGIQDEPFLHIDGDIFLFHPFIASKINRSLVYQNLEIEAMENGFYTKIFKNIHSLVPEKSALPRWVAEADLNNIHALNAGIFGGHDIGFFKTHAKMAFDFFDKHAETISKMRTPPFANHIAEQVLSESLSREMGIDRFGLFSPTHFSNDVTGNTLINKNDTLINNEDILSDNQICNAYLDMDHFGVSPFGRKYVHFIGDNKTQLTKCKMMARRLHAHYPDTYTKILDFFSSTIVSELEEADFSSDSKPNRRYTQQPGVKRKSIGQKALGLKTKNAFMRTSTLYRLLTQNELVLDDSIDHLHLQFGNTVASLSVETSTRLKDVFQYEYNKICIARECENTEYYEKVETWSAQTLDCISDAHQQNLNEWLIHTNPLCETISSKWNWNDSKSYAEVMPPEEPTHWLILPDIVSNNLIEIPMTELNELTLSLFASPKTFEVALKEVLRDIHESNREILKRSFFNGLVYLVVNGVLLVEPLDKMKAEFTPQSEYVIAQI